MTLLARLSDALWSPWLLGLFLLTGLVYSLGSGFFQLFRLPLWMKCTLGSLLRPAKRSGGGLTSLQALATALASTIGTGSIAGVATAIVLGGPGAVFWMWTSALLGMMTSCAEKLLSVAYQRPAPRGGLQGGPMFYLRDGLGFGKLAAWFSLALLPATLAGGNLVQSASISSMLNISLGWNRGVVGLVVTLAAGLVMTGGIGRIARASSALVPVMALLYLGGGGLALCLRAAEIPNALALIFRCAFTPAAALGGSTGYTVALALRYGVARGVFTNEAGLGTSAMAHGAARVEHPARQGMWGIFEVFVSTMLVCSVTALVILTSGTYDPSACAAFSAAPLTAASFAAVLGPIGRFIVAASLLLFAFSSILGWSYYGQQALRFLTGDERLLRPYRALFLACVWVGAVADVGAVWQLVDLCNALMAIPNLTALLFLAPEALRLLFDWERTQRRRNA